jgi:hypothetical protein
MTALLAATVISLRRRDTTETLRYLVKRAKRWPDFSATEGLRALRRAARIFRANCLAQSIALTVALERAEHRPVLILGCRLYPDRRWGAHAWVVAGAEVLDALPSGAHAPLAQLASDTQWVPGPVLGGTRESRR